MLYSTAAVHIFGIDHRYRTGSWGTASQVSSTKSGFHLLCSQALGSAA